MCGIAGILHFDSERVPDAAVVAAMTDILAHRGPDGRGIRVDGPMGLGHRRLSIVDLSEDASQPMCNEDGTVWVVFNGEVYNFRELRNELLGRGHTFRSRSDTEVLVHLYEEAGDRLVDRLRGMFALALWDARSKRVLLARDRFGQKPLYYRLDGASLQFASEIKAILQVPEVPRVPDLSALDAYFTFGYVPTPRTAFEGIRKLPPAHCLAVESDGRHRLWRYWNLAAFSGSDDRIGRREEIRRREHLLELLDEATRMHLIADVPLGAFLSGGLDSSAIVAAMCRSRSAGDPPVRTFTIGFDEPGFDERPFAACVADHLGTVHKELILGRASFGDLERIAWHYGEPFADSSCLPTFAVSELAKQHVTVALTGDGGDELFHGYRRYATIERESRWRRIPEPLRRLLSPPLLLHRLGATRGKWVARDLLLSRRLEGSTLPAFYASLLELADRQLKDQLYGPALREIPRAEDPLESVRRAVAEASGATIGERCAVVDASTYLPDDILTKVDVASMAFGLECRAPFLDHHLAEFAVSLPFHSKQSRAGGKTILRQSQAGRLPPSVLTRRKKGFSIPMRSWFAAGFEERMRDLLLSERASARGFFQKNMVEKLIAEHARGTRDHQATLFALLMFEQWHRLWIDRRPGSAVAAVDPRDTSLKGRDRG